jgi:hypothetical protein
MLYDKVKIMIYYKNKRVENSYAIYYKNLPEYPIPCMSKKDLHLYLNACYALLRKRNHFPSDNNTYKINIKKVARSANIKRLKKHKKNS